jgi:superfamily II DNA/RNA helicase
VPKSRRKGHMADRFEEMAIPQDILDELVFHGFDRAFEIQQAILPDALSGRDVLARAETGAGKTLAYTLALTSRFRRRSSHRNRPLGLVLAPTRELAAQAVDQIHPFARAVGIKAQLLSGGMDVDKQVRALEQGVEIAVGTPGRILDLMVRGDLVLDRIESTVIDEADHMAELGLYPQVREILLGTPMGTQKMLFSATLDADDERVETLVDSFLVDPVMHQTAPLISAVRTMTHAVVAVQPELKVPITSWLASRKGKTLVFARTQKGAERIAQQLREDGVHASALHSGKQQGMRSNILAGFKTGAFNVLVATEIAARGLDVPDVTMVLHVDPAEDVREYVHRSGRTARAGAAGTVVTLVLPHQHEDMAVVEDEGGFDAEWIEVAHAGDSKLRHLGARKPEAEEVADPGLTKHKGAPRRFDPTRRGGADAKQAAARRENEKRRASYTEREEPVAKGGRSSGGRSSGGRASGGRSSDGRSGGGRSGSTGAARSGGTGGRSSGGRSGGGSGQRSGGGSGRRSGGASGGASGGRSGGRGRR